MTGPAPAPVLIACAHGTDNARGRAEIDAVRAQLQALRPDVEVLEAYVDVQQPDLVDVVAALPQGRPAVIVPLLLSVGYHVKVDIARAAAGRPDTVAALPLGPDPRLAHVLQDRLDEASVSGTDAVVLAAAGSSDPCAAEDVADVRAVLAGVRTGPVRAGFGVKATPSVRDAVTGSRDGGDHPPVAIASYLLAPGYFHDRLARAGAEVVSAPLLPHPVIAELALARYDDAVRRLGAEGSGTAAGSAPCDRPCRARTAACVRDGS